jgi:MoaA/NifB/PqqE/SkfB family radical SAM enzyme
MSGSSKRTPYEPTAIRSGLNRLRIDLKLGFNCNNRCRFCVQGDKRHRFQDLSTAEAKRRLEGAIQHSDAIVFTGGEVTIRSDITGLVRYARSLGFNLIQIQTNGRMLSYTELVLRLARAGVTEFSPALHGHTPELHEYLTRCPGSFEQTVQGIRNVKAMGFPVITNSVVTRSNYRHLGKLARLLTELGVDQYQFAFVHALGTAERFFNSVVPRMELIADHVMEGLDVGRQASVWATTEAIPPCILPGYEEHLAEWILPDARIYDAKNVLDSYATYRVNEGKAKGPDCVKCGWNETCEGVWREYSERFGSDEFRPVDPDRVGRAMARLRQAAVGLRDSGSGV